MKIFVSCPIDDPKPGDFNFTTPSELLYFGFECSTPEARRDCGCDRSMVGVSSSKATTLFRVTNLPLSQAQLANVIYHAWARGGWTDQAKLDKNLHGLIKAYTRKDSERMAEDLVLSALPFDVGDLVERDGKVLRVRAA